MSPGRTEAKLRRPERTCVGCRRRAAQEDLVRLTRSVDGALRIDGTDRAPGRGAYVCSNVLCFEKAVSHGGLARALRGPVTGAEEVRERFEVDR